MSKLDSHIGLAHGNGGRYMRELIAELFARHLANPLLDTQLDAAPLPPLEGEVLITAAALYTPPLAWRG